MLESQLKNFLDLDNKRAQKMDKRDCLTLFRKRHKKFIPDAYLKIIYPINTIDLDNFLQKYDTIDFNKKFTDKKYAQLTKFLINQYRERQDLIRIMERYKRAFDKHINHHVNHAEEGRLIAFNVKCYGLEFDKEKIKDTILNKYSDSENFEIIKKELKKQLSNERFNQLYYSYHRNAWHTFKIEIPERFLSAHDIYSAGRSNGYLMVEFNYIKPSQVEKGIELLEANTQTVGDYNYGLDFKFDKDYFKEKLEKLNDLENYVEEFKDDFEKGFNNWVIDKISYQIDEGLFI